MSPNLFTDKTHAPESDELAIALGCSIDSWNELRGRIAIQHAPVSEEWIFGGKNHGWSLRLKQKKRAVLYLTPCPGFFRVGLAMGEKAVRAALQQDLPASVIDLIERAPKYAEGRGIRIEIRTANDLATVEALAAIKMAN